MNHIESLVYRKINLLLQIERRKKLILTERCDADTLDSVKGSRFWLISHVCRLLFANQFLMYVGYSLHTKFPMSVGYSLHTKFPKSFKVFKPRCLLKHPTELLKHSVKHKVSQSWIKQKWASHNYHPGMWRRILTSIKGLTRKTI